MTDSTQKPGVTDELPTLRQPEPQSPSDQVPTPHRPDGKVILAGAAAEDQEPAGKTNVDEPPSVSGLVAGGSPVGRTLPSGDDGDVRTTAPPTPKPTALDADPEGSRATVVAPVQPTAARAASGSTTTILGIGALVLATLGAVGYFALRPRPVDEDVQADDAPTKAATATSPTSKPSAPGEVPAPSAAATATPSHPETAGPTDATGKPTTPGTAAPSATSSSGHPGVPPPIWPSSTPSWVPTAVPTVIPSVLPPGFPTTFPFPTAPAPTTPPPAPTN